jgi:hypothetical protein
MRHKFFTNPSCSLLDEPFFKWLMAFGDSCTSCSAGISISIAAAEAAFGANRSFGGRTAAHLFLDDHGGHVGFQLLISQSL